MSTCKSIASRMDASQNRDRTMQAFFYGWKRKIGCVMLALACVLMVGWLRSFTTQDTLTIGFGKSRHYKLVSVSGQMMIVTVSIEGDRLIRVLPWMAGDPNAGEWELVFHLPDSARAVLQNSISIAFWSTGNSEMGANYFQFAANWCQFPYWSVVVPLTLLTAWLLLSKPKALNPNMAPPV